jgi:hypothetical protein
MNNLKKAKEELETSIANAMEALKIISAAEKNGDQVAKWEPEYGFFMVAADGSIIKVDSEYQYRQFGTERATKEKAESASVWMRKFNRLKCWFEENAPHEIDITFDDDSVSIIFSANRETIDDLRTKIRDGIVEL